MWEDSSTTLATNHREKKKLLWIFKRVETLDRWADIGLKRSEAPPSVTDLWFLLREQWRNKLNPCQLIMSYKLSFHGKNVLPFLVLIRDKRIGPFQDPRTSFLCWCSSLLSYVSSVPEWRWDGFEMRENALAQCIEALCSRGSIESLSFQLHRNVGGFRALGGNKGGNAKIAKTGFLVVRLQHLLSISALKCLRRLRRTRKQAR